MDHHLGGGSQQAPPPGAAQLQLIIQNQAAAGRRIRGMEHQPPNQLLLQQQPQQNPQLQPQPQPQPQQQPPPPPQLPCPRCNSRNTKFCYYNNYSLSQPRYFCKGCRRYWTHGGTLRNVPVGGGCRKSKRPKLAEPAPGNHHLQGPAAAPGDDQGPGRQIAPPHRLPTINAATGPNPNLGLINSSNLIIGSSSSSATLLAPPPMIGSLYTGGYGGAGGGFLSSLGAIQAMHQPRPQLPPFSQHLGGAGDHLDSPLLQGFALPSFGSILQQAATSAGPSGVAAGNQHQDWMQAGGGSLMGNVNLQPPLGGHPGSDPRFWSIGSSSGGGGAVNININNDQDNKNNNGDDDVVGDNSSNNGGGHVGTCAPNQPNQWPHADF